MESSGDGNKSVGRKVDSRLVFSFGFIRGREGTGRLREAERGRERRESEGKEPGMK